MSKGKLAAIIVGIIVVGGAYFYMIGISDKGVLKVAFPLSQPVSSYEPTQIHWDYEYILLENIYSPLVEFDVDGNLEAGIAEHADWQGNELHLKIRNGLKTENGTPITADDVIFSLKRLLVLTGNTHGNFKDLVCPGVEFKTVEDSCPEIRRSGNEVIIQTKRHEPFLLPMLAAIDFAIIPRSSTDPKTLKIVNFKETSGPYYVDSDDGKGHIVLKLNPHHYHASRDIPQTVDLVPEQTPDGSLNGLLAGKVDHITSIDLARAEETIPFSNKHSEFQLHTTMNIRKILLVFTERGLKELSKGERLYIGRRVRQAFLNIYKGVSGHEPDDEFFPSLGDGGLSEANQEEVISLHKQEGIKPHTKIMLGLIRRSDFDSWAVPLRRYLPEANVFQEKGVPDFTTYKSIEDMPQAFIAATDSAFMEDINLISYSLNAGFLGLTKSERTNWLTKYMSIGDKKDRMKMLRELQFQALTEPVIVPLISSPYTALIRKPWQMKLSHLYANNQLWRIKRK